MYIDVDVRIRKGNRKVYNVCIYRDGIIESITSNSMKIIAQYIRNIVSVNDQSVYIDNRGFGRCLIDYFEQMGVPYIVLKHKNLKFNIPE